MITTLSSEIASSKYPITDSEKEKALNNFKQVLDHHKNNSLRWAEPLDKKNWIGHFLAGYLEGDGHISIPALGKTSLNRILNPRVIFTGDRKNLGLFLFFQSELAGRGRFQVKDQNTAFRPSLYNRGYWWNI